MKHASRCSRSRSSQSQSRSTPVVSFFVLAEERPLAELEGRLNAQVLQYLTGSRSSALLRAEARAFSRWAGRFAEARRRSIRAETWRIVSYVFLPSFMVMAAALLYYIVDQMLARSGTGRAAATHHRRLRGVHCGGSRDSF
jgi:hypothetical protein